MNPDLSPDLNEIDTTERNRDLDRDILRPGIEIAGLTLRNLSAGDMALLMDVGVGLVIGRMDSVAFDVGAILWAQSQSRDEVRRISADRAAFRAKVYDFLDEYDPTVFAEATPRIMELIERMEKAKTSPVGSSGGSGRAGSKKAGGRAG
jgi:hypothetical protein